MQKIDDPEPFESETLTGIDAVKVLVDRRIDQRTTDIEALRKHGDQTAVNMLTGCKIELEDLRRELEWIEVSGLDTTEADQIAGRL